MKQINASKVALAGPKYRNLSNKMSVQKKYFSNVNHAETQYPFKFNGFDESIYLNTSDHDIQKDINYLFNESPIKKGIFAAYNNYIDGLLEADTLYLEDICEGGMFKRVDESISNLDSSDYYVEVEADEEEDLDEGQNKVKFSKIVIGLGISMNRNRNNGTNLNSIPLSKNTDIMIGFPQDMTQSFMGAIQYGVQNSKSGQSYINTFNNSVFRVESYIEDTRKYRMYDRKSNYKIDQNEGGKSTYHKIVMEMPMDNFLAKIQGMGFSGIYKISQLTNRGASKNDNKVYLETIKELQMPSEYEFFIADVDDFMNGNPFGKNVSFS